MRSFILIILSCCVVSICYSSEIQVGEYRRVRQDVQDTNGQVHVFLHMLDYNTSYELVFDQSQSNVFSDTHALHVGEEIINDVPAFYNGVVKGFPGSSASGTIYNNTFEGVIYLDAKTQLFIENGVKYFGPNFCQDSHFCYLIYNGKTTDLYNKRMKRSAMRDDQVGICGWHSERISKKLNAQISGPVIPINTVKFEELLSRRKREVTPTGEKICGIFMQADRTLWNRYLSDFSNDKTKARTQLLKDFAQIIDGVNKIYKQSTFISSDGTVGPFENFQFRIDRTSIYEGQDCATSGDALCRDNIDSDEFLNINSQMNHDRYCLAYLVGHCQFSEGVQGLAWVGYPKSYAGGVCQRYTKVGSSSSSYNTGIVTTNNYGRVSPISKLILTFAHEIGHNFGSPHDTEASCQPGGAQGNYIMYPYLTPGNLANNDEFSSCSKNSIALNVDAVIYEKGSNKRNCFTDIAQPFCGNGIKEDGESCDCGFADECAAAGDWCCVPGGQSGGCNFVPGATCSPSNGICCDTNTCNLLSPEAASGRQCRPAGECSAASYCTPTSAACPNANAKPDGTLCWENSKVCISGECTASLCSVIKDNQGNPYQECQEEIPENDKDLGKYCNLACRPPSSTICINSATVFSPEVDAPFWNYLARFRNSTSQPIKLGAGTPCNNYKGYCDVFYKCRNVNPKGAFASLFALLQGDQEVTTPAQWLVKYWWVVAIAAVVFIIAVLMLTQLCARICLDSTNPKKHSKRRCGDACKRTFCPCIKSKVHESNDTN